MVGKGAFGKVRIVERKDTGLTFALKYIRKDEGQTCTWNTGDLRERKLLTRRSCTIGERAEHHSRAQDAGASEPSIPLQPTLQLPGH